MGVDYTDVDPDLMAKIEAIEANKPGRQQVTLLGDLAKLQESLIKIVADNGASSGLAAAEAMACLEDIKKTLSDIKNKEQPKDQFNPVIDALSGVEKALTKAIKGIEVSPKVNVQAPKVDVSAPVVDLKGVEKALTTEMPKAFEKAIKLIPDVQIPETDLKPLQTAIDSLKPLLEDIDTGVRLKAAFPKSFEVSNLDEINITASASTLADFNVNDIEEDTTSYFGYTKPDGTWMVKALTDTSVSYATETNNGSVTSYTDAWTNRATLTFERFDEAF